MLTEGWVLRPVVVGVGLSILGTVFGHWLDLFLVSEKKHRRRAREPDWPAVGTAAGWEILLGSSSGIIQLRYIRRDTAGVSQLGDTAVVPPTAAP